MQAEQVLALQWEHLQFTRSVLEGRIHIFQVGSMLGPVWGLKIELMASKLKMCQNSVLKLSMLINVTYINYVDVMQSMLNQWLQRYVRHFMKADISKGRLHMEQHVPEHVWQSKENIQKIHIWMFMIHLYPCTWKLIHQALAVGWVIIGKGTNYVDVTVYWHTGMLLC